MTGRSTTVSYRQLGRAVNRMALGLLELGVAPGDVVAFQMPNWWQFTALYLACARVGAVANPLLPIFRERELKFMLGFAEAKVIAVPRRFRGHDYPAMLAGLRGELPALRHVLAVEDGPDGSFEQALLARREDGRDAAALLGQRRPGPDEVTEVIYTSGTTGEPKGVMHTPNTLLGAVLPLIGMLGLTAEDATLMGSPLAHQTGFLYGLLTPLVLGAKAVLMDIWDPAQAARHIHEERVTFTMGSTPFVADLADTPALARHDVSSLRLFVTAGAPVPRVLVQRARERLGAHILSAWGMTENGAATCTGPEDPPEKVFESDGRAIAGDEVRVVDASGKPVPPGREGRLQARGTSQFVGYLKRPEKYDTDAQGWFETGDLARMDADGFIRISGRSKDIIIRGGENVPVAEVEGVLYQHPAVQDVALVAMPDERLGERACAFVQLRNGQRLTFEEMVAYLESQRMARAYFPERLEVVDALPRTASGKIQKFMLRRQASQLKPMRP
jgi:cyclohexanecarboxylate-CoA ligase